MTTQVHVTAPGAADEARIAAVTEILAAAYAPYAGLSGLPDMTSDVAGDLAQGPLVWVGDGSRMLGLAVWTGPSDGVAHLMQLAVHPKAGGRGVGRSLLAAVEAAARAAGATRLALGTHTGMTSALALYARTGWTETGRDGARVFFEKPL